MINPTTKTQQDKMGMFLFQRAFNRMQEENPILTDVVSLCAFLYPEYVPKEVVTRGMRELSHLFDFLSKDPSALDEALKKLPSYGLLKYNPCSELLVMHRLTQDDVKEYLPASGHRLWAERAVKVVNQVFPNYKGASNWSECRRCLRCAETCVEHIKQWHFEFEEAAHLLHNLGLFYHWQYGAYDYALETSQLALAIRDTRRKTEPLQYAVALKNLGLLHKSWKEYDKAQPLLEKALDIRRDWWGEASPKLASLLVPLIKVYEKQGRYCEAENYYKQLSRIYYSPRIGKTGWERVKKTLANYDTCRQHCQAKVQGDLALQPV